MSGTKPRFTVHDGDAPPAPQAGTGHYFDQTIFDMHYRLLALRAQRMAGSAPFEDTGFTVDEQGNVTLTGTG